MEENIAAAETSVTKVTEMDEADVTSHIESEQTEEESGITSVSENSAPVQSETEDIQMTAETEISEDVPAENTAETEETVVSEPVSDITGQTTKVPAETEIMAEMITESAETEEMTLASEVVSEVRTENVPAVIDTQNPYFALLPIAAAGIAAGVLKMKSKKSRKNISEEDTPLSARERDAVRLSANKPDKKKKEKNRRDHSEKERKNVSKSVLSTLPYKKVLSDDIFFLGKKMYSKAYTFDDINFNLADEEQQYMYLERYIEFLGILDDSVDCQICCWNSRVNMEKFRNDTLLKQKADELFDYRHEFNTRVLEANILKGQNAVQKHMYITLTIKAPDEETAVRRFKTLDITAINTFNRIGNTGLRALTSQERIEMLKDYYIGHDDMPVPHLTEEDYAKGREKLFCAPDYFDFKKDYFMFNDTYAKVLYIREYPSAATSDILAGLLGTGVEIMVTTNIETYDSAEARKLVQRQITAVDTDMAKREVKAAQHGNFSSVA